MLLALSSVCVPGAVAFPLNRASRYAAVAPRSTVPPAVSAAPGPGSKESHTPATTRSGAAEPNAPATVAAAGHGWRQGSAHPAAAAGRRTTAPSASHAARPGAHSTAGAMPPAVPPAAACAAPSSRSGACRAAADVSRSRRSASLQSARAPSAGNDTPPGAPKAPVWIAGCLSVAPPAAGAAPIVPTPARPSVISCQRGRRRSP